MGTVTKGERRGVKLARLGLHGRVLDGTGFADVLLLHLPALSSSALGRQRLVLPMRTIMGFVLSTRHGRLSMSFGISVWPMVQEGLAFGCGTSTMDWVRLSAFIRWHNVFTTLY